MRQAAGEGVAEGEVEDMCWLWVCRGEGKGRRDFFERTLWGYESLT